MPTPVQLPTIGSIVFVRLAGKDGPDVPKLRPATIVRVWGEGPDALVNVQMLVDGTNDIHSLLHALIGEDRKPTPEDMAKREAECVRGVVWLTSIAPGDGLLQWRWPARA